MNHQELFKNYKIILGNLSDYGFSEKVDSYEYTRLILDERFLFKFSVSKTGLNPTTELIDLSTNEPYYLHLSNEVGEYINKIREEYLNIIDDIIDNCYKKDVFKTRQASLITNYIKNTYNCHLEFLFKKYENIAVMRRNDNKKWYGVITIISKKKLNINCNECVEIINLKCDAQDIDNLIDNKKIFSAYHMNKKNWITIILDNEVEDERILQYLDNSYKLVKG